MTKLLLSRVAFVACCLAAISAGSASAQVGHAAMRNNATVEQQGAANAGAVVQNGQANNASLHQFGNANTGTITQNGDNNAACLIQWGSGLDGAVVQTGDNNSLGAVQTWRRARIIPASQCAAERDRRVALTARLNNPRGRRSW